MKKRLIILGGGPGIFDRAEQRGAEIFLIDKQKNIDPQLAARATRTLITDYESDSVLIDIVKEVHRNTPFDAVVSLTELGLLPAAQLSDALHLPGLPISVVERLRDKYAMRRWLDAKDFPSARAEIGTSIGSIAAFAERVGYPLVIKPIDGLGSLNIVRVKNAAELDNLRLFSERFLMEEYLDGKEISVESFSFAGHHVILGITEKILNTSGFGNPYVEIGHKISADLSEEEFDAATEYVRQFLDVIGITDGCAHTEVMLTANGPRVIETHNRVGGGNIPQLVRLTTGHDLLDLSVAWPLKKCCPISFLRSELKCGAVVRFFTPKPGVVTRICGAEKWKGFPGVVGFHFPYKVGDQIKVLNTSSDRTGYVITIGPNSSVADAICQEVMGGIQIETKS